MIKPQYDSAYLTDPTVFQVGRLPAVSDHDCYRNTAEADAGASSLAQSLNGLWKFHYCQHTDDRPQEFFLPEYDVGAWHDIRVPGHIQLQGCGKPQYVNVQYPWDGHEALVPPAIPKDYNPVGSYVRYFDVPSDWRGQRVVLTFQGVETALYCWLNGEFIGYAEDSFTPSRFDITHALRDGANKLAVEVYRFSTASWLEDQDFWRFSGIFRDVELSALPQAHVNDIFVHTELADDFASATLRAELALDLPDEPVTLCAQLWHGDTLVDESETEAKPQTLISRPIRQPMLWSAEQPELYTLRLVLKRNDEILEVAQTRVGFRRFEIKDATMLLNGRRILFHGADRHEFCAKSGRALPVSDMLADIVTMKRHNINAVRTSHYPNSSAWYRLCDEYGIYLIDECNLETHGTWQEVRKYPERVLPGDHEEWLPAVLDRARSMQERDKNHPSVLIWSCGNESFGGKDIYEMSQLLRRRDPSRVVHYEGVFNDRRYPDTSDIESQMYTPAEKIRAFLKEHQDKPFILCEYTHAMGNSNGGMHKYVALEDECPRYQGGFIWDYVDQAILTTAPNGKPRLAYGGDFGERPNDREFSGNGLVFADRTPTPKLQEVKYLYQDVRITPDDSGVTLTNRYLFKNTDAFTLRWRLERNGAEVQRGVLDAPDVPAGETRRFALPVIKPELGGEYVLHCGLYPRAALRWAAEDHELMHGEAVIAAISEPMDDTGAPYRISRGGMNIGARGEDFEMLFNVQKETLCALRGADARELLATSPMLSLYRAPTSNDMGNDDWRRECLWQAASLHAKSELISAEEQDGRLCVRYRYELPLTNGATIDVCYTVLGSGRVRVDMEYAGCEGLPDMAAFGLSLRLPVTLQNVEYYGFGPDECYCDRMSGARLGRFGYRVRDNLTPYLMPQECGNREGVRALRVTDDDGRGVSVERVDAPLSVSVLPHSAMELAAALHMDELAEPTYTYLDIALCRKGVGGDDSWGAPVHEEYHIKADQPMKLSFVLGVL